MALTKTERRNRIKNRVKTYVSGTAQRPRLSVFRSNKQIYAQLIDDINATTMLSASSSEKEVAAESGNKSEKAVMAGKLLAKKALDAGIESVVFDRNGYLYHGRVKQLADAARECGLKF
jgi:large subunit ribosomal protein L18